MEGKSMLCRICASSCNNGEMILAQEFCSKFSSEIPETVYLAVRNGDSWRAYYRQQSATFVKLGAMMSFYMIKSYNIIFLRYKGAGKFTMQIFNENVEIEYPLRFCGTKKPRLASRGTFSELEIEKMARKFLFSASGNSKMSYDLAIETQHLQISNLVEVMLEEGISKLRLQKEMSWIELAMEKSTWVIKLIWKNGRLYFDEDWITFTKALNLRTGDICVISQSRHSQKFHVALFEKSEEVKVNYHFYFKSFKILTNDMLDGGELELPRAFIKAYGDNLSQNVMLFMADGSNYQAQFCELNNLLYGLEGLFVKYGLGEGFYIFFDYVGPSYLYLSVFNTSYLDIFDCYRNKKSLKHYRQDYMILGNDMSDCSEESSDDSRESSLAGNRGLDMTVRSHETLSDYALGMESSNDISQSVDGYNSGP